MEKSPVTRCIRGSAAVCLAIALAAAGTLHWSRNQIKSIESELPSSPESAAPLYLPEVKKVKLITLGFNNFVSNILWFNTLNYFGKQLSTEQDYRWLGHMCTLVTDLNPHSPPVVEFCATMLPWVAHQDAESTALLKKAIAANPTYWRYQYLLGFNYWYFHEDFELAADTLRKAAELPDAPAFIANLAARLTAHESDPEMAVAFLENMLKRDNDENARAALEEKLELAKVATDIRTLESVAERYQEQTGAWPKSFAELAEAKLLPGIPLDPYGDPYQLDAETGEISSKKGEQGLHFPGKTARTGLAKRGPNHDPSTKEFSYE